VRKRRDAHFESDARDSAENFIVIQDFFRNRFGVADEQRNRLLLIADRCPVHRTLSSKIVMHSTLVDAAPQ
jgi:uncharacterized OsmC-like protein